MRVGDAAPYVAGAYVVVFVALLAYMWLIASKLGRLEERLGNLRAEEARPGAPTSDHAAGHRGGAHPGSPDPGRTLEAEPAPQPESTRDTAR